MTELLLLLAVIGVAVAGRWLAGRFDRDRIREDIENRGGKILDITWNPFGPGWWGSNERIYHVKYETRHGKVREANCKTRMSGGVYWAADDSPFDMAEKQQSAFASGETITCLKCGATIQTGHSRCHKCGWSYIAG